MPQIDRKASIIFSDASIIIREPHPGRMPWAEEKAWEREFRNEVLKRIVQQLKRMGWSCTMPTPDKRDLEQYGEIARNSARNKRFCVKGDLKADLELSSAHIKFEMFQNVNAPSRPDHDGRYEFDKEAIMPYLLRLEMERTRRRIRTYLCNIFSGYYFDTEWMEKHSRERPSPGGLTAMDAIVRHYDNSSHFKGWDWDKYKSGSWMKHNVKSADGQQLEHGQIAWFADRKGRLQRCRALYNINNMWWVITGPYSYTNVACFELYANPPAELRRKQNDRLRRKRLESELNAAVARMDYRRAEVLRDLIWPPGEPVFCLWHTEHKAYHCAGFCGYTAEQMGAGKFTRAELQGWDKAPNQIVAMGKRPD